MGVVAIGITVTSVEFSAPSLTDCKKVSANWAAEVASDIFDGMGAVATIGIVRAIVERSFPIGAWMVDEMASMALRTENIGSAIGLERKRAGKKCDPVLDFLEEAGRIVLRDEEVGDSSCPCQCYVEESSFLDEGKAFLGIVEAIQNGIVLHLVWEAGEIVLHVDQDDIVFLQSFRGMDCGKANREIRKLWDAQRLAVLFLSLLSGMGELL